MGHVLEVPSHTKMISSTKLKGSGSTIHQKSSKIVHDTLRLSLILGQTCQFLGRPRGKLLLLSKFVIDPRGPTPNFYLSHITDTKMEKAGIPAKALRYQRSLNHLFHIGISKIGWPKVGRSYKTLNRKSHRGHQITPHRVVAPLQLQILEL